MKVTLKIEMELDGDAMKAYEAMIKVDHAINEINAIEVVKSCTMDFQCSMLKFPVPPPPPISQEPKSKRNI
jgi:hypothetical protein